MTPCRLSTSKGGDSFRVFIHALDICRTLFVPWQIPFDEEQPICVMRMRVATLHVSSGIVSQPASCVAICHDFHVSTSCQQQPGAIGRRCCGGWHRSRRVRGEER